MSKAAGVCMRQRKVSRTQLLRELLGPRVRACGSVYEKGVEAAEQILPGCECRISLPCYSPLTAIPREIRPTIREEHDQRGGLGALHLPGKLGRCIDGRGKRGAPPTG